MSIGDVDLNAVMNEYAEMELKKWHYIDFPYDDCEPHKLLPSEANNHFVARFKKNHKFTGCINKESGEKVPEIGYEECRYYEIDGTIYDMCDPKSIMKIPIPSKIAFDFHDVPIWYVEEFKKEHNIQDHEEVYLNKHEVEKLVDRAKKLTSRELSQSEISELRELFEVETEIISDSEISFWIDFVVMPHEEFLKKYPGVREKHDEGIQVKYKSVRNGITSTDLYCAVERRGVSEFQKELVVPLSHIAVNIYISYHDELCAPERLIAQLFATGAEEYAIMLDAALSKMVLFWHSENTINYGKSLRGWARNSYEYIWLQNYVPELIQKSKGAYTTSKHKKNMRYIQIKDAAKALGFELMEC